MILPHSFAPYKIAMNETYGVIILAGGKSSRMNFPKIYLEIKGKTFLRKIAATYCDAGLKNICMVINKDYCEGEWKEKFNSVKPLVSMVEKTESESGKFHSLKLGAKNLLNHDFVFIQNADNPFVNREIIEHLMTYRNSYGYSQVTYNGFMGHPILISKKIVAQINSMADKDYNLRDVLKEFPRSEVEVNNEGVLANINTKEDYEKYFLHTA
ncbi:MAG TPA: NTP transferase domain-containing protein [Bacteroidia bacterium]|nr:NTP transferase domain-containing protein [Bacteroidia bacterium]